MRKWDFNLFVVLGAILGIFASILPWYTLITTGPATSNGTNQFEETVSPADVFLGERGVTWDLGPLDTISLMLMVVFVAGAVLSLHSPICGLVQVVSVPSFMISIGMDFTYTDRRTMFEMEYGVWMALLSSAIVLIGLILPIGGRTWRKLDGLSGRLFTFPRGDVVSARVNLLAFIGACLVLMSLALPNAAMMRNDYAMSYEYPSSYLGWETDSGWATIPAVTGASPYILFAVSLLLVGGAVSSMVTPMGGLATLSGLVLFWSNVLVPSSSYVAYTWLDGLAVRIGVGSVVAAVGAIVLMVSIVRPVGPVRGQGQKGLCHRILIWS